MSEQSINNALKALFKDNKVVFWCDDQSKLKEQYEEVEIENVNKIIVQNNEFWVKNQIIKSNDNEKFLLYFLNGAPSLEDNWLLDLQLAHRVFNSDQESMFLQEVGLGYHFKELIRQHITFFESKERRMKLKELLTEDDNDTEIQYKMMAVLFGVDFPTLEAFIQTFANDFNNGNDKYEKSLIRYNLKERFWNDVSRKFNYQSEKPTIYDFLLDVFARNFKPTSKNKSANESRLLIAFWKDAISYQASFQSISNRVSQDLNVSQKLSEVSINDIIDEDIFRDIDRKIIHELIQSLTHESIDLDKLLGILKARENKYWYFEFKDIYLSLEHGAEMIELIRNVKTLNFGSVEEGALNYSKGLYEIDYHYRKFIYHYRQSNQSNLLSNLYEKVNKVYSNDWLLDGGDSWQKTINETKEWSVKSKHSQFNFFDVHVKPVISKGQRLFVIISDALRYENGYELYKELQIEKRYDADLDYMISGLPSYTQLGMAALLPHKHLNIYPKDCTVLVDEMSSMGTAGRTKILETNSGVRSVAIGAEEFYSLKSGLAGRDFIKKYDLIYIYHNQIDDTGDKTTSETKVFDAVKAEIKYLKDLVTLIVNLNGSKILITADHGYIYQNDAIAESDFAESDVKGDVWKENRRFVIGSGLTGGSAVKKFNGTEIGLTSDVDILLPKGINRLRIKGAGSRFVHGGASLQEIVVPMLNVSKKDNKIISNVDVDIIKSTDKITTNILAVTFIQKDLVSDIVLPRIIRAVIKAKDGTLISDTFSFNFDIEEGTERERAIKHRFQLSAAATGKYKGQRVALVIEEPVPKSSKWKTYSEHNYTLNISFMNDFNDF